MKKKRYVAAAFLLLVFITGFLKFYNTNLSNLNTYNVVGFKVLIILSFIYAWAIYSNKKSMYYASTFSIIFAYLCIGRIVLNVVNKLTELDKVNSIETIKATFGPGFYMLILGFILIIINIFLKDKKEEKNN